MAAALDSSEEPRRRVRHEPHHYIQLMQQSTHVRTETETFKSDDTMLFDRGFNWVGVRNGTSLQLYTYASRFPASVTTRKLSPKTIW